MSGLPFETKMGLKVGDTWDANLASLPLQPGQCRGVDDSGIHRRAQPNARSLDSFSVPPTGQQPSVCPDAVLVRIRVQRIGLRRRRMGSGRKAHSRPIIPIKRSEIRSRPSRHPIREMTLVPPLRYSRRSIEDSVGVHEQLVLSTYPRVQSSGI